MKKHKVTFLCDEALYRKYQIAMIEKGATATQNLIEHIEREVLESVIKKDEKQCQGL